MCGRLRKELAAPVRANIKYAAHAAIINRQTVAQVTARLRALLREFQILIGVPLERHDSDCGSATPVAPLMQT